ncbi:winged helix-turn-helix domain-containing protein [Vibrio sp.]|nr:winged helix-turn-helix domain-containing protein [Vibrio sp.]
MIYKLSDDVLFDTISGMLKSSTCEVKLTQQQNQLLHLLCKESHDYLTKETIISTLYNNNDTNNQVITKLIFLLRSKLSEVDLHDYVETRHNYGYKIKSSVELLSPNQEKKREKTKHKSLIYISISCVLILGVALLSYLQKPTTLITPGVIDIKITKQATEQKDSFCAEVSLLSIMSFTPNYDFSQNENITGVYSIFIDHIDGGTSIKLTNNTTDTIELQKTYPTLFNENMYRLLSDVLNIIRISHREQYSIESVKKAYSNNTQLFCTAQYDWFAFMTGKTTSKEHAVNARALFDSFSIDELDEITLILYMKFAYEAYSFGTLEQDVFEDVIYNDPISSSKSTSIQSQIALYEKDYDRVINILSSSEANINGYTRLILYNAYLKRGDHVKAKSLLYTFNQHFPDAYQDNLHKYVDIMFQKEKVLLSD